MLLFYIRHGDPVYSPDSLTPQGELQAAALAKRFGLYGLDRVYVSSSVRAQRTAEPTCRLLGLTPEILEWTNEKYAWRDFAPTLENEKKNWAFRIPYFVQLFNSPQIRVLGKDWASDPVFRDYPFADGIDRIQRETDAFLSDLGYDHDPNANLYTSECPNDQRVALFAHQGFGLVFLSCVLDIPYPQFATHFDMGHTGVTAIEFQKCGDYFLPRVLELSNDSHLYREGLPTNYQNRIRF